MNADSFIRLVAKKGDFFVQDTDKFMSALVASVNECVEQGESFTILNFGTLHVGDVKERTVKSKMFGDRTFPATKKMFFTLSGNLKKLFKEVNKQENSQETM